MLRNVFLCLFLLFLTGSSEMKSVRSEVSDDDPFSESANSQSVRADFSAAAEKAKLEPAEAIQQALTKQIDWDFNEIPLSDVVEALHKDLKIPIRLDTRALNDLGVATDVPIIFKLSGITAKTALKQMLQDLGLTFCPEEEVLVITSPEVADNNLTTEIYDVSDLPAFRRANGQTVPNYEKLIDIITESIKPITWDLVGGCGNVQEYDAAGVQVLVISQTWEVHEQIRDLFNRLRKLRPGALSEKEIQKLPPEPPQRPKPQFPALNIPGPARSGIGGRVPPPGGPHAGSPGTSGQPMAPPGTVAPVGQGPGEGMF